MDDQLLAYYNRELAYLSEQGAEFSKKHPNIAGRIKLDATAAQDPHVSRLIESFAFLTARIRYTLDDSFPELTQSLLSILAPSSVTAQPAMNILQMRLMAEFDHASLIPAGTVVYSDISQDQRHLYTTLLDTCVLPADVGMCRFMSATAFEFQSQSLCFDPVHVVSEMSVELKPHKPQCFFNLSPEHIHNPLRFFIDAPSRVAFLLYEFLFEHLLGVAVMCTESGKVIKTLPSDCVNPSALSSFSQPSVDSMGLGSSRDHGSFQLLSHFFSFPKLFSFFELTGMEDVWSHIAEDAQLVFYFSKDNQDLVQHIKASTLKLGCVPASNVFNKTIRTGSVIHQQREVRVQLNSHQSIEGDVHQVHQVFLCNASGDRVRVPPLYGFEHQAQGCGLSWVLRRELSSLDGVHSGESLDTYVGFVDSNNHPVELPEGWQIEFDVSCTNRNHPIPEFQKSNEQAFHFYANQGAGVRVASLHGPTRKLLPKLNQTTQLLLLTKLSLQSFTSHRGVELLKQVLRTLDRLNSAQTRLWISGIVSFETQVIIRRLVQEGRGSMCQGTAIHLVLEASCYSDINVYIFGVILNEFFAQMCAINSFIELTLKCDRTQHQCRFPPRSGTQGLL